MDYSKYIAEYDKIGYGEHGITLIHNFLDEDTLSMLVQYLDSVEGDGPVSKDKISNQEVLKVLSDADKNSYFMLNEYYGNKYGIKIKQKPKVQSHLMKWDLGYESVMPVHSDCETKDGNPVLTNEYYKYNLTVICYLNDTYEGGEITFPQFNLNIKPKPGDLIMFPSRYRHGVLQMYSGNRYSLPSWYSFDIDGEVENFNFPVGNGQELF